MNNQNSSPSKDDSQRSLSQVSYREESKSNIAREGEGDGFDTIAPLDFDNFLDRRRPVEKNFSEPHSGKL
jgi:hypothetical protein